MERLLFRNKNANRPAPVESQASAAEIRVLMCAGCRVGKTSIMAAMDENARTQLNGGDVMVSIEQITNDGSNPLVAFRQRQMEAFSQVWNSPFYYAEESNQTGEKGNSTASQATNVFVGNVRVKNARGIHEQVASISFRDPRGEDFSDEVTEKRKDEVREWIRESQVIIIAIDTPRLMECDENGLVGAYHEAFNKPEEITDMIKQAWQADAEQRLILFVPLKCERYLREGRGEEIIKHVQEGYKSLITYIRTTGRAANCSMAIVPCETMGGLEFRKFEPLAGYNEEKKPGVMHSVYGFRRFENGQRARRPRYCEQPLLYLLMFIFGMRKQGRTGGFLYRMINRMPAYSDLKAAHRKISSKCVRDAQEGFFILNDPLGFLNTGDE